MSSYAAPSELSAIGMEMVFNPRYGLRALATPFHARTFDYYISTTGSDSSPGTLAAPWSPASLGLSASTSTSGTFAYSAQVATNQALMAGKTIGLLNGTYIPSTYVTGVSGGYGVYWQLSAGGPSYTQPTVIAAVNPQQAILTLSTNGGTSFVQTTGRGDCLWLACNNVIVDGLAFNFNNTGAWIRMRDGALPSGGSGVGNGIIIQNCSFQNIDVGALYNAETFPYDNINAIELHEVSDTLGSNIIVKNCYFNGVWNYAKTSGLYNEGFNANCIGGFLYENITIYNCEMANSFSGFYPKGKVGYYQFYNNFVHDCWAFLRDANEAFPTYNSPVDASAPRNVIRNNVAFNVGAVSSGNSGNPAQVNTDIYNNTFCFQGNSWAGGSWGAFNGQLSLYSDNADQVYGSSPADTSSTFYNNIFYNQTATALTAYFFSNSWSLATQLPYTSVFSLMDYNCHDTRGFSVTDQYGSGTTWASLPAWRSGSSFDEHSFQSSPGFSGTPNNTDPRQMQLAGASPCVGTGSTTGISGGGACDMGAWGGVNIPTQIGVNFKGY